MAAPALFDLIVFCQDAIHGAFRAQVYTFVEQCGDNTGWGLINKPFTTKCLLHLLTLISTEFKWRPGPGPGPGTMICSARGLELTIIAGSGEVQSSAGGLHANALVQ